jgi:hypothetical protein
VTDAEPQKTRANWLAAPAAFILNQECCLLREAFGYHVYLVGSCIKRRDYRDVDVRCILPDEEFDALFPNIGTRGHQFNARWALMSITVSEWLRARTGLPVDFQFQRQTQANEEFPGREYPRHALGIYILEPIR